MNVDDLFWKGRPSDDERRRRRFELPECFTAFEFGKYVRYVAK